MGSYKASGEGWKSNEKVTAGLGVVKRGARAKIAAKDYRGFVR